MFGRRHLLGALVVMAAVLGANRAASAEDRGLASRIGEPAGDALVVIAEFYVEPAHIDAFAAAIDRHAARSRAEKEMLAFDVAEDPRDPTHFTFWEVFVDAAARARHRTLPSSRDFWPTVTPMLVRQAGGALFTARELRRRPLAR